MEHVKTKVCTKYFTKIPLPLHIRHIFFFFFFLLELTQLNNRSTNRQNLVSAQVSFKVRESSTNFIITT